jgi:signal transduction histidine kinase
MQQKTISRKSWQALIVLIISIVITIGVAIFTHRIGEKQKNEEFAVVCQDIKTIISSRLFSHALVLRAGSGFFAVTDTVTRSDWKNFIEYSRFEKNLPGIQGIGFSLIVPKDELEQHIKRIQAEGFPNYTIHPKDDRSVYTSIIYLEPFTGRNLRAFGYDMFSNPTRRKAMELARDNDVAMLSGRVELVQETNVDVQFGTLMYVPVYKKGLPTNTIEQRRVAIMGWVYSPYRMKDLMQGILGYHDVVSQDRIQMQVYDDSLSAISLMYDSQSYDSLQNKRLPIRSLSLPVKFYGKTWILHFSQSSKRSSFLQGNVLFVLISGAIISILLYWLTLMFIRIENRSNELKCKNDALNMLNAEKDKFLTIIAHDLKNPLLSIGGLCEILAQQAKGGDYVKTEKYANMILQSSKRASDLLMNLMEWALSQTGRIKFNPVDLDLVNVINEVELLLADSAKQKGIKITKELPLNIPVRVDNGMVSTILRNLLSNAIKFTLPGGQITISATKESSEFTVSVNDTGVGIPKENIEKLFRIDESISTYGTQNEKGTGIGLILSKGFVEKHGGKIWVESIEGEGSRFSFSLPLC